MLTLLTSAWHYRAWTTITSVPYTPSSHWGEAHVRTLGANRGWTAWPPGKRSSTDCIGGGLAPRPVWAGLEISSPPGFELQAVEAVASHYTDWAIRAADGYTRLNNMPAYPSHHTRIGNVMQKPHKMNTEGWKVRSYLPENTRHLSCRWSVG